MYLHRLSFVLWTIYTEYDYVVNDHSIVHCSQMCVQHDFFFLLIVRGFLEKKKSQRDYVSAITLILRRESKFLCF